MELLGLREPGLARLVHVQGRGLVRVLAVAKDVRAGPGRAGPRRELRLVALGRRVAAVHPARHRDVVGGGVLERLRGKTLALLEGETATLDSREHVTVGSRVDDDRNGRVVLRRGAHHRRATDVDLLDALVGARTRGDRLRERVEVHDDELERLDAQIGDLVEVVLLAGVGEDAGVHARVQGLHPALEALGEAGQFLDLRHRHACVGDGLGRGAGRDQLDTCRVEPCRQLHQPALVVHADQRAAHSLTFGHRGSRPFVHRKQLHGWRRRRPSRPATVAPQP